MAATSVGGGLLLLQVRVLMQKVPTRSQWRQVEVILFNLFGFFPPSLFLFFHIDRQPHWLYQSRLEESREGRQQGKEAVETRHQAGRPGAQHDGRQGTIPYCRVTNLCLLFVTFAGVYGNPKIILLWTFFFPQ